MEYATYIRKTVPSAEVTGKKGRRNCFEIKVNNEEIFSKLKQEGFPKARQLIKEIKNAREGQQPKQIEKKDYNSACTIL
ncbi:migration and invasion enhancer 1-like [Hydractinia symbiolongicarpus]|uniref:migration and invasion enhancer 1-like n=1 Tax=Hydractinia symbiolongicarpus TaxID=13093 RepID=UPI00254EB2C0|nr:migration and invasion enhancer 1-like [Hydractinia symbiolongicarpus]